MATLTFDSNPSSALIQGNLSRASDSLSQSLERLSSGLRINKAADDPAGLALAEQLRTDARVFTQAIKNVSDGISLVNTADSAVTELSSILSRLKELATQAYNPATTSTTRTALHNEAIALASEYDRVVSEADYNTRKLLDGSLQNLKIQAGYGTGGEIKFSLGQNIADLNLTVSVTGSTVADGTFTASGTYVGLGTNIYNIESADFNGDGYNDIITTRDSVNSGYSTILLGNGNGSFKAPATVAITGLQSFYDVVTGDFNGDSYQDFITLYTTDRFFVNLGNGNGTFKAGVSYTVGSATLISFTKGDFNEDGYTDIAVGFVGAGGIYVSLANGNGTFKATSSFAGGVISQNLNVGDFNGDGYDDIIQTGQSTNTVTLRLGNGNGTFKSPTTYTASSAANLREVGIGDLNGDGYVDLAVAAFTDRKVSILIGNGNGTFKAPVSYDNIDVAPVGLRLGDADGDGDLDIFTLGSDSDPYGYATVLIGNGNGSFKNVVLNYYDIGASTAPTFLNVVDYTGDGVLDIAALNVFDDRIYIFKGDTVTSGGSTTVGTINLLTQSDALTSISIIDNAVSALSIEFGAIAGADGRLSSALNHLSKTREILESGRSKIMDVDAAEEVANYLKQQIIQQSGAAILAQANLSPKLALSLLDDL